jgi:hypothetical protein
MIFTDAQDTTWLYFTTTSGILYAAGGFLGVPGAYIDSAGGNVDRFWRSFESNVLTNTPVIDGSGSLYVCAPGYVYKYSVPPTSSIPTAETGQTYYQPRVGSSVTTTTITYTSPVISSQNKLSFVGVSGATNYIFTIS